MQRRQPSVRKVCVVIGSRANYGSIKSVMRAVRAHPDLTLQIIVGASALLDRFGSVVDVIERDGFIPDARVNMIVEGETPVTMAKSTGLGLLELPTLFELLKPDVVITVGDRFETMATAVAGAYMNIPLAHTMGGEVTGTIDESIRHAITKLAHLHFPANREAADRILRLGEHPEAVHVVGCPRIDLLAEMIGNGQPEPDTGWLDREGVGGHIRIDRPFLLVSQHPVTTEYGQAEQQITETLVALDELRLPTIMLWPNVDAGSEDVSRGMRKFRERHNPDYIRFYKNFPVETYLRLMTKAACLVGNSSASIREGAFMGTPAVNIGTRQDGRERGPNVVDVGYDRTAIAAAITRQIEHGPYPPAHLYGDGCAGKRIADVLARAPLYVQKRIQY
jgi:UDP-hydrolysing UDP-N-acetyl-D-glucosamine 2-epimerase